jgi:hypothetical protein
MICLILSHYLSAKVITLFGFHLKKKMFGCFVTFVETCHFYYLWKKRIFL